MKFPTSLAEEKFGSNEEVMQSVNKYFADLEEIVNPPPYRSYIFGETLK